MRSGQCEMAIVGGVNTILTPDLHISFSKAGMLSGEGRCKTFSDRADGHVRSEGVGALLLKKLGSAEEAGRSLLWANVGRRGKRRGPSRTAARAGPASTPR